MADTDTDTEEIVEAWSPDPRWAYPAAFTTAVWGFGWAPQIAVREGGGFPPWLMAIIGLAVAVGGFIRAGRAYPRADYGVGMAEHASFLAVAAGAVIGAWLVYAGYTSPWQASGLLAVAGVVLGAWWALILTLAPRRHADELDRIAAEMAANDDEVTRAILDRSGCEDVRMYGTRTHRGGYSVEIGPDPDVDEPPSYAQMCTRRDKLTTHLAMYWRRKNGTILHPQDVNIERVAADRWMLHVSTNHVLEKTVPFLPDRENNGNPPSFNDPLLLGMYEDGEPIRAKLHARGGKLVGATGGGKSVFLNNMIGRTLECRAPDGRPDGLVIVIAAAKLVPLVYNWLVPWFSGSRPHPAIAGVFGQDRLRVNRALVGLYDLVNDRNSRLSRKTKHEASPDLPGLLVILEEATILTAPEYGLIQMHEDGADPEDEQWWSASQLLNKTCALARSAGVSIWFATQFGLVDALGQKGSEIMRNLTVRCCVLTLSHHDGPATLPGLPSTVDTTQLENNSLYFKNGMGEKSRAMAGKAGYLDEDNVIPVAANVSREVADLSERDKEAFGRELWETRWNREFHPDLALAAAEDAEAHGGRGYTWPTYVPPTVTTPPALPPVPPAPAAPVAAPLPPAATVAAPRPDPDEDPTRVEFEGVDPDEIANDWDAALRAFASGQTPDPAPDTAPDTAPEPPAAGDATGRGATSSGSGLPWGSIERLEYWSRKCREEAAEAARARGEDPDDGDEDGDEDGDDTGGGPSGPRPPGGPDDGAPPDDDPYRDNPVTGWCRKALPEPLGTVVAYLDAHRIGDGEFVPSAELADAAFGPGVRDAAVRLGKALSNNVPGLRAHRNAKDYPALRGRPAGRGRGFWARDLRAAAKAYRSGGNLMGPPHTS